MSFDPANMLPPEYDDALPSDYDPGFTADISTKMRVPHRLAASDNKQDMSHDPWAQHSVNTMNIPDKLVVLGQEQSLGVKDDHPKLHLDLEYGQTSEEYRHVGLQTPPRVLTLEDRPYPGSEDNTGYRDEQSLEWSAVQKSRDTSLHNGYTYPSPAQHSSDSLTLEASMSTPGEGLLIQDEQADDISVLRRQMAKLSRHVMRLEEENSKRSNRELILYPLVITYVLFHVGKWFMQISK